LLAYFPRLRDEIDVVQVAFERPRPAIIDMLGEDNQGCPVIVLADRERAAKFDLPFKEFEGKAFIDDEKTILAYLSLTYKVSRSAH